VRQKLLIPALLIAVLGFAVLALAGGSGRATADTSIDSEEQSFIDTLNQYRVNNSLPPLLIDPSLQAAADWMSTDLGEQNYFDHTDSTGRDPWTRMCDFGYCYNAWKGENIAAGYVTGADVFQGWKGSPGHNANMLGPNYRVMGLARVFTQGSSFSWYWTNDFGSEVAPTSPSPPPAPTDTPAPTASPSPTPTQITHPTATPTPALTTTPSPVQTSMPTPTPAPPTATPSPTPFNIAGDVNCDSRVTGADSVRILQFVANVAQFAPACPPVGSAQQQSFSGGARYLGDIDCSGVVDALDALAVLRYMAGDPAASCGN
jgi:uncharacterized protein YkwD